MAIVLIIGIITSALILIIVQVLRNPRRGDHRNHGTPMSHHTSNGSNSDRDEARGSFDWGQSGSGDSSGGDRGGHSGSHDGGGGWGDSGSGDSGGGDGSGGDGGGE